MEMCIQTCNEACIDTVMETCIDTGIETCIETGIETCIEACMDTCIDKCIEIHRYLHRHALRCMCMHVHRCAKAQSAFIVVTELY